MSGETKKLMRSQNDRWLAGVCGGLGQYFGIDPTIIRIVFALLGVFTGSGFLLYLILWVVMPVEQSGMDAEKPEKSADFSE